MNRTETIVLLVVAAAAILGGIYFATKKRESTDISWGDAIDLAKGIL